MKAQRWWGEFQFTDTQLRYWQLGGCLLGIERTVQEWQVATDYSEENERQLPVVINAELPKAKTKRLIFNRYAFAKISNAISLTPVLADRAQVSRPEFPFYIPSHQTVTVYISSPIWVRLATEQGQFILTELPSLRQSDTWFGENNLEGELCYASRTRCRTQLDLDESRPYRVTTRVDIKNQQDENLLVQRIKLPLPVLSIFADQHNNLWTETLHIENNNDTSKMIMNIERTPPAHVSTSELISSARVVVKSNRIIDMFTQIL